MSVRQIICINLSFFSEESDASSFSTAKSSDKHIQLTGDSKVTDRILRSW